MIICPTITAYDSHEYREQLERVETFAKRIHIDVMDGVLAPVRSLPLIQTYWPDETEADIHLMYERPLEHIETLVSLAPHMVIIHAEADGDIAGMIRHLQQFDIKVGVALLQSTKPADVAELLEVADHALIFSGKLGYHGGRADMSLLEKVKAIQEIVPGIEIGWDGGATTENIAVLKKGGVDVCNVGSSVQHAKDPEQAFNSLRALS